VFWFSLQLLSETLLNLRNMKRDMTRNVINLHVKYLLLMSDFNKKWIFSTYRGVPRNFVGGRGVQQIQLRTEDSCNLGSIFREFLVHFFFHHFIPHQVIITTAITTTIVILISLHLHLNICGSSFWWNV